VGFDYGATRLFLIQLGQLKQSDEVAKDSVVYLMARVLRAPYDPLVIDGCSSIDPGNTRFGWTIQSDVHGPLMVEWTSRRRKKKTALSIENPESYVTFLAITPMNEFC
jgi:hypothetical protein